MPVTPVLINFCAISFVAVCVCVYDKCASKKKGTRRVPEATLLSISALGGSVAMYLCMNLIRHKTRHAKFTVGLPVIIVLQGVALYLLHRYIF